MKILQVCSAQSLGGGELHVIDLVRGLVERGHTVHIAVRKDNALQRELADIPIIWHELPLRNALDLYSASQLAQIIRANKIEIMHAHVARDYAICGLAAKWCAVKLILTRHHFNPIRANPLYRWALQNTSRFIAVSDSVRANLLSAFPHLDKQIVTIPNWIHSDQIALHSRDEARAEFGLKQNIALAVIGQITPVKGQMFLLEALNQIQSDPQLAEPLEVRIIGSTQTDRDRTYEIRLRQYIDNNLSKLAISFTGHRSEIGAYLNAFDLVVIPSRNEGFSLVAIEAMAAGCVVIAADVAALREIIEHSDTGYLFRAEDSSSLAQILAQTIKDPSERTRIGKNAQQMALGKYSRSIVIEQIISEYTE